MTTLFRPDYYAASVHEITVQWLQSHQLDTLLLDADNTLKRYHNPEPEPGVEVWLAELRQAGIRLCIVSNGLGPRIQQFANLLKLPVVCKALKPRPTGLRRAGRPCTARQRTGHQRLFHTRLWRARAGGCRRRYRPASGWSGGCEQSGRH
ncbi:MAG: hypothetical protein PHE53_05150, partial [Thermoguttaceae bacterium]|nr:hypothetical protein [Thermoguttaceae bacterium]